jgi:hypothetical protein
MRNYITLISGFGRCGSSMVMQMLAAGGMPMTGKYPLYEDPIYDRMPLLSGDDSMRAFIGKAFKLLVPTIKPPPKGYPYKCLWIDRDHTEQAKSARQWLQNVVRYDPITKERFTRRNTKTVKQSVAYSDKERPKCLRILQEASERVAIVSYEDILADPRHWAWAIGDYFDGLDTSAMASVVLNRSPKCSDGSTEYKLLEEHMMMAGGFL